MPTYTQDNLVTSVKVRLHNQLGQVAGSSSNTASIAVAINDAVRKVTGELDLRSMKRKSTVAPNLFNDIYQYNCPTDLKANKVIGIQPQIPDRSRFSEYHIVPEENFDQLKQSRSNLISFTDRDMTRKILASVSVNDLGFTVSPLDDLTTGGTWSAFGDATNLVADTYDYVKGNGSIKADISSAGGTTFGIQSSNIPTFDLTNYKSNGSAFVWVRITSTTNITNYKLRLGSDSSNYYEMTATTTNEGTSFTTGWNLLRFDFSGKSTTGTPDDDACDYAALYMTKAAGKISETDYRFDHIIVKLGQINNLVYYSKYPWQTSSGTWIENSTASTDKLNADTEEYDLFVEKSVENLALGIREYAEDWKIARENYKEMKEKYKKNYPSEALLQETDYYFLI